jgi:hypothetical protein
MNIFVLHENPIKAARLVPVKVASKMALEAAQMLAVACAHHGLALPHKKDGNEYSPKSHVNHPCTKWACQSKSNMNWLALHGIELCKCHEKHYGKLPAHSQALKSVFYQLLAFKEVSTDHTPFVSAMPDEFKTDDVVESYWAYIKTKPYYVEGEAQL